jgi:hypothetical protein
MYSLGLELKKVWVLKTYFHNKSYCFVGFKGYRHPKEGSFFGITLAHVLADYSQDFDLKIMFELVSLLIVNILLLFINYYFNCETG